jgi:hypothetical protein
MTGPPAATPSTVPAQIRAQQIAALKFCSENVEVRENGRLIDVISEAEARRRIAKGGYEAEGHNTVKYLRRLPRPERPPDGPQWKGARRAADSYTVRMAGIDYEHRFAAHQHPWPAPGKQTQEGDREETGTSSDFAVTR